MLVTLSRAVFTIKAVSSTQPSSDPAMSNILTTTEDIPLYPNSLSDNQGCSHIELNDCWHELYTNASVADVIQFYKDTLQKEGWVISNEMKRADSESWALDLILTNKDGVAPMRRRLSVSASQSVEGGSLSTFISLGWERWPDPFRVPVYPTSENVQSHWEQAGDIKTYPCGQLTRITTFTTSATPDDLAKYYQVIMPLDGWGLFSQAPGEMQFAYNRGWPERNSYSTVTVNVQPALDNTRLTRVEIQVVGDELMEYCLDHGGSLGP
jgi:hypothetical protein